MAKIVGIGACVMDTLYNIPTYPAEDTKMRAVSAVPSGGGPVATGLVAAAKLGIDSAYIGNLSSDSGGKYLMSDFEKYGVGTENIRVIDGYRSFTSTIWLCADTSSRTCVFDKGDLPPLALDTHQKNAIIESELLMVDGNEMDAAVEAAKIAAENGVLVLYDCGGRYEEIEKLLALTDIVIPSEEFALGVTGKDNAIDAAKALFEEYSPQIVVVTRGKLGGVMYDGKDVFTYPIYPVDVKDSNGSGDVFHGAFATAVVRGYDFKKCCHFASATAALKCAGIGARASVPSFDTVQKYMKENGYEL